MARVNKPPNSISFLSWNVLNDLRKILTVVAYLYRHNVDVAILQETHLSPTTGLLTQRRMKGACVAARFTSHARGVLIWVHQRSGIQLQAAEVDIGGRCILAKCPQKYFTVLLVGVYRPNYDDPLFYHALQLKILKYSHMPILWGG